MYQIKLEKKIKKSCECEALKGIFSFRSIIADNLKNKDTRQCVKVK